MNQLSTIEGNVVQFVFRSPHSWIQVRSSDGKLWSLEWSNAKSLRKQGISAQTFRVGDDLIVTAHPSRKPDEQRMFVQALKRQADGFTWGLRGGGVVK